MSNFMKLIFDYKFRFYTSKINEICLHCHLLYFSSIILSFGQCEPVQIGEEATKKNQCIFFASPQAEDRPPHRPVVQLHKSDFCFVSCGTKAFISQVINHSQNGSTLCIVEVHNQRFQTTSFFVSLFPLLLCFPNTMGKDLPKFLALKFSALKIFRHQKQIDIKCLATKSC